MQHRNLGASGVKVSPLCLGAMMFGGPTDAATSARIIDRARDQGVNFIDTADGYAEGRSEEIVGRAIKAQRDWWVLASKIANPQQPGPNGRGLSRHYVMRAVEASLRRLGTETIDVLYLHKEDPTVPIGEVVHALADLIRAGKLRYFGLSNHRAWRVAEFCRLADDAGIDRPVVSQPLYNALNRMAEVEHLPACAHFGLGVFPYSPLARGVLTGKYRPDVPPPEGTRAGRQDARMMQTEWRPVSLHIAQAMAEHAAKRGVAMSQWALAWVLRNRMVTGPRTEAQWEDYVAALEVKINDEDEALVNRLVPAGHASTPGYNDPAYPIEGRAVG